MTYYYSKITRYTALLCLLAMSFAQCKRPEEPSGGGTINSPVFSVKGSFDAVNRQFTAGVDSIYMFTSYRHDNAQNLYEFTGRLKKINCGNCAEVQITLTDSVNNNGSSPVDMDLVLSKKTGYGYYYPQTVNTYSLVFNAEEMGYSSPSYLWDFGNGQTSTSKTAVGVFFDTSVYKVCLTVKDAGCQNSKCNYVKPISPGSGNDSCLANFSYFVDTATGSLKTDFVNTSYTGGNYFWDFGDGNTSTSPNPENQYTKKGSYQVCLTATNGACKRTLCKTVVVKDTAFTCATSFSYNNPAKGTTVLSPFSKVKITYTDDNGEVFESMEEQQPSFSYFFIDNSKEYDKNEAGQKTKQLNVRFRCRVFSKTGTSFLDIINADGVIGIAYP